MKWIGIAVVLLALAVGAHQLGLLGSKEIALTCEDIDKHEWTEEKRWETFLIDLDANTLKKVMFLAGHARVTAPIPLDMDLMEITELLSEIPLDTELLAGIAPTAQSQYHMNFLDKHKYSDISHPDRFDRYGCDISEYLCLSKRTTETITVIDGKSVTFRFNERDVFTFWITHSGAYIVRFK